jgi:hypothetical protein
MDILINVPTDSLLFINLNIRFAGLESILFRSIDPIIYAVKSNFKKIKSLESEEQAGFVSIFVLKYSKKKCVDDYLITKERYNNLSIVEKFMRIFHDWIGEISQ